MDRNLFWLLTYPVKESGPDVVRKRAPRESERNEMIPCLDILLDAYIGSSSYAKRKDAFAGGRSHSE